MNPLLKLAELLQAALKGGPLGAMFMRGAAGLLALAAVAGAAGAAAALWTPATAQTLAPPQAQTQAQTQAQAQPQVLDPALQAQIQAYVLGLMQSHPLMRPAKGAVDKPADASAPKTQVNIGAIDPRLRLAPCALIEPYLPSGSQLSGKSRIGLRCLKGPTAWRISVPVHIQVLHRGLVALTDIRAGSVLSARDFAMGDIDRFADADTAAPIVDLQALEGRITSRALGAGEGVRQSHLKPKQWFSAGDSVRVIASGKDFAVTGEGQALTPGFEGQPAKVKMNSGRVVRGTAVAERQLTLDL